MDVLIHWRNFTIFYSEGDGVAVFSHCWFYPEADCILSRRRCIHGCCLYSFLILLCLLFYFSTLPHYPSSLTIPLLSVLNLLSKPHHWSARGWVNSAVPEQTPPSICPHEESDGGDVVSFFCLPLWRYPAGNFLFPVTILLLLLSTPSFHISSCLVFISIVHRSAGWPLIFTMLMFACREDRVCAESMFPEAVKM